jgi:hypothetical protein
MPARNPSYWEGGDWEDHSSRTAQAKCQGDPVSKNKLGVVAHTCDLNYLERKKKDHSPSLRKNHETLSEKH